jgi:hypothetical protein
LFPQALGKELAAQLREAERAVVEAEKKHIATLDQLQTA